MRTGQWLVPNDGVRWWYDSGALSLDFAHTGVRDGPPNWEQFHAPADLTAWLRERFDRLDDEAGERDLSDALGLRASIYSLARAAADGDAVTLFSQEPGRIRECSADNCALVFYDESRTNNRRWCSMRRCGNRAKVKAFRSKEKL